MDLLFHMVIPVMLALIAGVDRRRALMLAPIAIIPDLDVLLVAHRVYLHTVFIPVTIVILCLFLFNLKQRALIHLPLPRREILFASLYYLSHLLFDLYPGPVAVFWPLTSVGYRLNIGVIVNQQSVIPTVQPYIRVITKQIQIPNVVTNVAAATMESTVTAILFLTVMFLTRHKKGHQ